MDIGKTSGESVGATVTHYIFKVKGVKQLLIGVTGKTFSRNLSPLKRDGYWDDEMQTHKALMSDIFRKYGQELVLAKRKVVVAYLRVRADDKDRFDVMTKLAKDIITFRGTPALLPFPDIGDIADPKGLRMCLQKENLYNQEFFQAAAPVLRAGQELFGDDRHFKKGRNKYPKAYAKLSKGNIDGVQCPISWTLEFVDEVAMRLYGESRRLSVAFKPEARQAYEQAAALQTPGGAADIARVENIMTEMAVAYTPHCKPHEPLRELPLLLQSTPADSLSL